MSTDAHMAEPRCSFCGRAKSDVDVLVNGPDQGGTAVRICDRCIEEAAGVVDGGDDGSDAADGFPEPTTRDYDRAFEVYAWTFAPIQDLLRRAYGAGSVRVLALTIAWLREREGQSDYGRMGLKALASCLRTGWPGEWKN